MVPSGPRRKRRRSVSASGAVAICASSPPTTAPASAATGCHASRAPADSACGPIRDPIRAPTAKPTQRQRLADQPAAIADRRREPDPQDDEEVRARHPRSIGKFDACATLRAWTSITIESTPKLKRPTLVAAFRGWNDAGGAASLAAGYLRAVTDAERFAVIDPDPFIDYQQTRPSVTLEDGHVRNVEWPETEILRG